LSSSWYIYQIKGLQIFYKETQDAHYVSAFEIEVSCASNAKGKYKQIQTPVNQFFKKK